jgi:hypothetical protein
MLESSFQDTQIAVKHIVNEALRLYPPTLEDRGVGMAHKAAENHFVFAFRNTFLNLVFAFAKTHFKEAAEDHAPNTFLCRDDDVQWIRAAVDLLIW